MSAEAVFKRISATNVLPGMQRSDNNEKPYNAVSYSGTSGDIDGLWQQVCLMRPPGCNAPIRFFDFGIIYILCVYIICFPTYPFLFTFSLLSFSLTYLFLIKE